MEKETIWKNIDFIPCFCWHMGDKPVIFLYSSIFLYSMLYSCRNSFGKWNFFVIFLIYIPKKKSLILFKAFVTVSITILHTGTLFAKKPDWFAERFLRVMFKKTQEKRAASGLFAALLNNIPGVSYFSWFPFLRLHT